MKQTNASLFYIMTFMTVAGLMATSASAQEIEFASSPNPVGSGARALGMGGAFIAIADDATAASWNPGGLINLEKPEISIVGAGFYRNEDNTFSGHPEANGSQSISKGNLNYLSAAYPFIMANHNMVVVLTNQYLYDFNRSWQFAYNFKDGELSFDRQVDYNQVGGLSALGFSYAIQINPALSAGLTFNVWNDDIGYNHWSQNTFLTSQGSLGSLTISETYRRIDEYNIDACNFNFGFLWRISQSITIGGVLKMPFTADVYHTQNILQRIIAAPPLEGEQNLSEQNLKESYEEELDMPASYGIGIAYRFSDALTASFDIYRTEWDDMIYSDFKGNKTSAISGQDKSESNIDPTVQIRVGMEYLIIRPKHLVPLRAGVFYDPAPSEDGSDNFYGITLGTGLTKGCFVFDMGYQFRYGNNVGSAIFKSGDLSQDVKEHTLYTSLILHFW